MQKAILKRGGWNPDTDEWVTPQDLFDRLNYEFGFDLDVCADHSNAKTDYFFSKEVDALKMNWRGVCWMNPPYGRQIVAWMKKAYEESQAGATVVCLVPSSTSTGWWHDYAMKGEIRFLRGRVKYVGKKGHAPFDSVIVIFRPSKK